MKKPNISEGPWEVREWQGGKWPEQRISVSKKNGRGEALMISPKYPDEHLEANAKAISAVPEMIDALMEAHLFTRQLIQSGIGDTDSVHHMEEQLEQALEKAGVEL